MLKQYYSSSSSMNSVMSSSSAATWEEKAFAEDAAGSLSGGGCIWPPRSYSCSFCMREFRSAQALGGHMNVHRRDRARLKQCLHSTTTTTTTSSSTATDHVPHHLQNHSLSFGPFSSPRAFISPHSSSTIAAAASWSGSKRSDQLKKNVTLMRSAEDHDHSVICLLESSDDHQDGDHVETDLTVGLINSVVRGNRQLAGSCGEEAIATTCKRPKIGEATVNSVPFSFFLQPASSSTEADLDLELRLGDPTPKVNYMS